jgi:hypothetical protein
LSSGSAFRVTIRASRLWFTAPPAVAVELLWGIRNTTPFRMIWTETGNWRRVFSCSCRSNIIPSIRGLQHMRSGSNGAIIGYGKWSQFVWEVHQISVLRRASLRRRWLQRRQTDVTTGCSRSGCVRFTQTKLQRDSGRILLTDGSPWAGWRRCRSVFCWYSERQSRKPRPNHFRHYWQNGW